MSAELPARGTTPLDPRGARNDTREHAQLLARGTTPLDPRGARKGTREHAQSTRGATPSNPRNPSVRRIRDEARDGLSAAAISLTGSIGVTCLVWLLLRWLG